MGMVHHRAVDLVRREEAHRRRAEAAIPQAMEDQADHADDVVQQIGLPEERRSFAPRSPICRRSNGTCLR